MNTQFVNTIALVFGVGSTALLILRIYLRVTYSEFDQAIDAIKGKVVTFPVLVPAVTATVCWAWLITAEIK